MKVVHVGLVATVACLILANSAFAAEPVTFAEDVAPILQERCQECHHAGSMAPMSLVTYEETRPWAKGIRDRVTTRQVPPWHIGTTVGRTTSTSRPSRTLAGRRITHHAVAYLVQDDPDAMVPGSTAEQRGRAMLMEWAIGKGYDLYHPDTGKLLLPGSKISWDIHYHAVGEDVKSNV